MAFFIKHFFNKGEFHELFRGGFFCALFSKGFFLCLLSQGFICMYFRRVFAVRSFPWTSTVNSLAWTNSMSSVAVAIREHSFAPTSSLLYFRSSFLSALVQSDSLLALFRMINFNAPSCGGYIGVLFSWVFQCALS